MDSDIFFPLRSNARALLAGGPVAATRHRIKLAALLHDRVLIEEGRIEAQAGPRASMQFWHPSDPSEMERWQTANERRRMVGREFSLAMAPSNAPPDRPLRKTLQSPTSTHWRATFEPLKQELPRAYPWLMFGHLPDPPEMQDAVRRWTWADQTNAHLHDLIPESFVRSLVIKNANLDLAVGGFLGATVSIDALHSAVATARVRRGDARSVLGTRALAILAPNASELDWPDIDDLRRHRDLRHLRAILREVEAAAWDGGTSLDDFDRRVRDEFRDRLVEANDRIAGSMRGKLVGAAVGWAVGELSTALAVGVPFVGGVVGGLAGMAADTVVEARARPRWLAAYRTLRDRSGPG